MFQVGTIVTLAKRCVSKGKLFVTKKYKYEFVLQL